MESKSHDDSSLLSGQLQDCIEELDQNDEPESDETSALVQRMIRFATSSLEGLAESPAHKLITLWRENPENWRWVVDDHYSRKAIGNIRKSVSRFLKLSPVLVGTVPSSEVNVYLREATRC